MMNDHCERFGNSPSILCLQITAVKQLLPLFMAAPIHVGVKTVLVNIHRKRIALLERSSINFGDC